MNPIDTETSKRLDWLDHQLQTIASLDEPTRQTLAERIYTERAALLREQPQAARVDPSLLATLGFSFTLVPARAKGPRYKNWQNTPKSANEAARHLERGGNVGVLCGPLSNHIICIDVDRGLSHILAATPELSDTLQCYRDDAPDRRKFFLRIDGPMPTSTRHIAAECEIDLLSITHKGSAKNATVLGTHPSGARYQMSGDHILTVRAETFDIWWQQWTGGPLNPPPPPRPRSGPGPAPHDPDSLVAQVKAHYSAYSVFDHFGRAGNVTEDHNGGFRLHDQGGLIVGDPNSADTRHQWYCHGAGVGGDQIDAWCYCQDGRILDRLNKAEFIRTIGEMAAAAGIQAPDAPGGVVDPQRVRAEILGLRQWVKSTSFAGFVPAELQSKVGYRTDSTDTKVADAILDLCDENGSFRLYISRRRLAILAGIGSHNTADNAIRRLEGWFLVIHEDGMVEVVASKLTITVPLTTVLVSFATTYSDHKADDLFLSGVSRTVKARIRKQASRLQEEMHIEQAELWHMLMDETERGLNEGSLRIVDALQDCDGQNRVELVESTGKTKSSVDRYTRRLETLGVLYSIRESAKAPKVYFLAPGWEEQLARLRPTLKTHKLTTEREERYLEGTIEQRTRYGKTVESQSERLVEVMVDLHECTVEEAEASVSEFISKLERFKRQGQMQPRHRNEGPTINEERRSKRYEWAFKRASDLAAMLEAGELMTREMIAEFRTLASKIGVDTRSYAEQIQRAMDRIFERELIYEIP